MRSYERYCKRTSMTYQEMDKYSDELQKFMHMCQCGHKTMIRHDEVKALCTWCGKYVYKNKKDEFMDRMKGKVNGKI